MRFRLIGLFGFVTLVATLCGIVFGLPLIAAMVVLTFLLLVSPAVWINGAMFGQGDTRAFFLGGLLAGVLPFAAVSVPVAYMAIVAAAGGGIFNAVDEQPDPLTFRLVMLGVWLLPGIISFAGGGLGWLTYRVVRPQSGAKAATAAGSVRDYRVIEGRLTTTPLPPPP
jgi:hypothetical protein